jgi:glycosyltransferase involved in cell wall biosynthesis
MADFLKRNEQEVIVYSKYVDKMLPKFQKIDVPVVTDLNLIKKEKFDIAHIHHSINAIEIRYFFPSLPIIYLSHGILPLLEQPPIFNLNISKFLVVSEAVRDNLIKKGVAKDKINIFRNIVDSKKFFPKNTIKKIPKKALILSARIDIKKERIIRKACQNLGIKPRFAGGRFGWIDPDDLPKYINEADIVISLGRGVIETMMCGRIPIVYGFLGGDGIIDPDNIYDIMKFNFTGKFFKRNYNTNDLVYEIKKYKKGNGNLLRKISIEHFSAEIGIKKLIDIYNNIKDMPVEQLNKVEKHKINIFVHNIEETRNYMYEELSRKIEERQNQINNLNQQLSQKSQKAENYKRQFDDLNKLVEQDKIHIRNLEHILNMIKSAKTFRIWQNYCRFREIIISQIKKLT